MAITYHTLSNFNAVQLLAIKVTESLHAQPQNAGQDGTVTYGYGYTFIRKGAGNVWSIYPHLNADLAKVGIRLTDTQQRMLTDIARSLSDGKSKTAAHQKLIDDFAANLARPDISEVDATTLFNADLVHQLEYMKGKFVGYLGKTEGERVFGSLANTREMVALYTLFYNAQSLLGKNLATALSTGDRAEAWFNIRYGWDDKDSRYNDGWAKRHYLESSLFGLYDTDLPEAVQSEEAKSVYRMLQLHRSKIAEREDAYGKRFDDASDGKRNMIVEANSDAKYFLAMFAAEIDKVPTINEALAPAKNKVIADLNATNNLTLNPADYLATNIYLDPNRNFAIDPATKQAVALDPNHSAALSAVRYDSNKIEIASNDILIGEGGIDYLIGGKGDDILLGGEGRDLYYYRTGDGNDRIVDTDGGIIVIHDEKFDLYATGLFVKRDGADEWVRAVAGDDYAVHLVTLTHAGPWRLALDGVTIMDLGDSPDLAKFGIVLSVAPETVPGDPTIVGDRAPKEFSAHFTGPVNSANYGSDWRNISEPTNKVMGTDAEGNPVVTAYDVTHKKVDGLLNYVTEGDEPDRADTLNGDVGIDYIQSKGGNDDVFAQGGNDRVEAGAGDDLVRGGGDDDVILGNAGLDILFGDDGKDTLYAGDLVPLEQAYVLGESDPTVSGRGDFLEGGANDDILVGSAADDVLEGGSGADVIYGGAGNDYLSGDGSASSVQRGWTASRAVDTSVLNLTEVGLDVLPLSAQGNDVLYGGAGDDWLIGLGGNDFLDGGSDNDLLVGWEDNDILVGGSGDDILMGDNGTADTNAYSGNDWLDGGDGVDTLYGNGGNDVLIGGKGKDIMRGGAGRDTYIFNKGLVH